MAKVNGGNGFKETEVGDIPQEWEVAQLADICGLRTETVDPNTMSDVRYVGLEHIESGNPRLAQWGDCGQVKSSKNKFYPSDILYGKLRPYLRKSALAHFEGISSTDILILKADTNRTTPDWLIHLLHTERFVEHAISTTGGTNLPRTSWKAIREYRLALPPLLEQCGIAHVLSTIQRAIATQEAVIAAAREVKQSLMRRLFTFGPYADPLPTKETEVGEVPETWTVGTLDDIKANQKGAIVSGPFGSNIGRRFFVDSGVPLIRGSNLTKGEKLFVEEGFVFITEEKAEELKSCTALANDLIFTAAGTLGQVGLIPKNSCYPKYVISNKQLRARIDESKAVSLFLFYWFSSPIVQSLIAQRRGGTSIPVINLSILRSLPVPLPSVAEQGKIAEMLSRADRKIEIEERRKAALHALFKSMLHELMTGKVRVAQHGL
jgi:type I restriction enzyme S subunit